MLASGDKAPRFTALDQNGSKHDSTQLKGKRYLVYFYPKDATPGCTVQACGLQSDLEQFNTLGILTFGVSMDSVASHKKFADKYGLTFPLLADTEKALIEAFGVWVEKSMYGKKYMGISRSSFLVGAGGKVEQVWEKVNTKTHAQDVLEFITGGKTDAKPAAKSPQKKTNGEKKSDLVKQATTLKKTPAKKTPAKKTPAKKTTKK
ncbi:MAG: thioredoxin-dependent thiol peroxidase [Arenimonas sp.]|nr:thioredoxin-dependent thiol peroxidase [Arenimonas sp.]